MTTIPANAVVNVIPNVLSAGGNALDLIAIVATESTRVPIGAVQPFSSALNVGQYFGLSSPQYTLAATYFAGFTNSSALPGNLLFAQYPATAVAAYLQSGNVSAYPLATLQAMSGSLTILMDGYAHTASNLSLSGATSFSAAAALISAALNATEPTEATFTGSIAGTTMTVSAVASGTVSVGQTVTGAGVTAGTVVTGLGTGTGLTGTYMVSQAQTVASESLTAAATAPTVSFDSISGSFFVTSGITGSASGAAFATGTLGAPLLMTQTTGAILSQGSNAQTPAAFMSGITQVTQNWATFMTDFDPDNGMGNAQKLAFAAWTNGTSNRYAYICWDTDVTATQTVPATQCLGYLLAQNTYSGTALVYAPSAASAMVKAAFVCGTAASINFQATNGRITFAFKTQNGLIADVTNQTVAANLGGNPQVTGSFGNSYNFVGAYATANETFVFFNRGTISGPFQWLDSYVNQIWLNNGLQLALIELLTAINSIPYNQEGYALVESACMDMINQGLNFGAIRAGITLSQSQIAEVNNAVGKPIASTLSNQGWYMYIQDATPQVRESRTSPVFLFYYCDGQSIQAITLDSTNVQ